MGRKLISQQPVLRERSRRCRGRNRTNIGGLIQRKTLIICRIQIIRRVISMIKLIRVPAEAVRRLILLVLLARLIRKLMLIE